MGYKIEIQQFPNVGYYIVRLEEGFYNCYKGQPSESTKEKTFETLDEARQYCADKLKASLKSSIRRK